MSDILRELRHIGRRLVIRHAANILAAQSITDEYAAQFDYFGADRVLCINELTTATADQRHSFERWQCCQVAKEAYLIAGKKWSDDYLTLADCIYWLIENAEEDGGPSESLTFAEVMRVVTGKGAQTP
jgi:hypothetical protein